MKWKALAFFVGICFLAAFVGSVFTTPSIAGWYQGLDKPFFNPPAWVFGPVWTLLYTMMGLAAYMVWETGGSEARPALTAFGVQLALNSLWSIIFFGFHQLLLAFIEIVILWMAIARTMKLFRRVSKRANLLMAPYLAWVSFAAVLNFTIWWLN